MKLVNSNFQCLALEGAKIAPSCTYPFERIYIYVGHFSAMLLIVRQIQKRIQTFIFYFLVLLDHGFHCGTLKLLEGH